MTHLLSLLFVFHVDHLIMQLKDFSKCMFKHGNCMGMGMFKSVF